MSGTLPRDLSKMTTMLFVPSPGLPGRCRDCRRFNGRSLAPKASMLGLATVAGSAFFALSPVSATPSVVHESCISTFVTNATSSRSLAVAGVSAVRIRDLALQVSPSLLQAPPSKIDVVRNDPEAAVASRLIPAVLLGALLGMERRALKHGLCVRTLMLVSSVSALATVSGLAAGLAVPVAVPALLLGVAVCMMAMTRKFAHRRPPSMSSAATFATTVASAAAVGAACGAGLPFLGGLGYLVGISTLRADGSSPDRQRHSLSYRRPGASTTHSGVGMEVADPANAAPLQPMMFASSRPHTHRKGTAKGQGTGAISVGRLSRYSAVTLRSTSSFTGSSPVSESPLFSTPSQGSSSSTSEPELETAYPCPVGPGTNQPHATTGRTVLRLAVEDQSGPQRVVEVAGNDLDDAIRELKRRDLS